MGGLTHPKGLHTRYITLDIDLDLDGQARPLLPRLLLQAVARLARLNLNLYQKLYTVYEALNRCTREV